MIFMFDDFDLGPQCEEFYSEEYDFDDIEIEDVTFEGIPLNGSYLEYLIKNIPD